MPIEIKVKCVCCGAEKIVGLEQKDQPMCDKCYSPMIVKSATRH
jgi:hypothetical protein